MNLKNNKGSVTLYVLLAFLFFLTVTIGTYVSVRNREIAQDDEVASIQKRYEQQSINLASEDKYVKEIAQLGEYEQNGLVFHLDGIINSKDRHKRSLSDKWYNIKNESEEATIINGCTIGKDYVQLAKNKNQYLETNLKIFDAEYTIEIVFAPLSFYNWNALWADSSLGDVREGWTYSDGRLVVGRENSINGGGCVLKKLTVGEKVCASFVANNTAFYGFLNGEQKFNKNTTIGTTDNTIMFNKRANNGDNKWYSIRVYDRALTAEEIAHNYEIDKARFDLTE